MEQAKRGPGRPKRIPETPPAAPAKQEGPKGKAYKLEDGREIRVEPLNQARSEFKITFPDGSTAEMSAATMWLAFEIKWKE